MSLVHIHAPQASMRHLGRIFCPNCKKRSFAASWFTEWYGWDSTCLRCGDSWQDGAMCDRPFMRGWRKKSIAAAIARWRRGAPDHARTQVPESATEPMETAA